MLRKTDTKVLSPTQENIELAASLLRGGEIVAIPTETVYGLAANAFNPSAVKKIFAAKGRPADNPLIVHIASLEALPRAAARVPDVALRLAGRFWPGPLTMIFEKTPEVPPEVTAGLSTVAVRFPSHPAAQAVIRAVGVPLAAPSANLSGRPSGTAASHVLSDFAGRIPLILDGGECPVGVESTVILPKDEGVILLRPGAVTVEMLQTVAPVTVGEGVLHEMKAGERALSPGLLHKHYSPKVKVVLLDGSLDAFCGYVAARERAGAMVFSGEEKKVPVPCVVYGEKDDPALQARHIFSALRQADTLDVDTVYVRMPEKEGLGLAVYNRLIRAAGFETVVL